MEQGFSTAGKLLNDGLFTYAQILWINLWIRVG
jgi:hypothetical protein